REESDARLLAAAAGVIAREGYLAATLERVGTEAGFSRGLASRKYGSKDGLIEAVIRHTSTHVHAELDKAVAGVVSPLDQLVALFERFVALVGSDDLVRAYFVLFSAMIANRLETRLVFDEVQQRFGQRLQDLIERAQRTGAIAPALPARHGAYLVGCLLAGIAVETTMDSPPPVAVDAARLQADLSAMLRRALGG
ncbi:MAG TPA: TetR/AcrR family transcriptional regulator, partial [Novosphingobium sp.]|nr:TetR/AcrR family transcriptional regulator [Novosphingobium sp.]